MFITVASGKGGTGKTLVSTSLALAAGNCTYMDLDVEEPNGFFLLKPEIKRKIPFAVQVPEINEKICTFCGKCAKACAYNALVVIPALKKVLFFPVLCHSCGHCAFVCPVENALKEIGHQIGSIRLGSAGNIDFVEGRIFVGVPSGVPLIRKIVSEYINMNELTIADASPGTSCPVVESIRRSDMVVLVTEPTPFGLSDLKLTVEIIRELRKSAIIVVNKDDGSDMIDRYSREAKIPVLLRIPYSIDIQKSYSRGIPLLNNNPELKGKFINLISEIRHFHEKN